MFIHTQIWLEREANFQYSRSTFENTSKYISAYIDTWTHSTGMEKFGTTVQAGDMQGFQTLDSLNLEPRFDPKSTKDNGSLLTKTLGLSIFSQRRIESSKDWPINPI